MFRLHFHADSSSTRISQDTRIKIIYSIMHSLSVAFALLMVGYSQIVPMVPILIFVQGSSVVEYAIALVELMKYIGYFCVGC